MTKDPDKGNNRDDDKGADVIELFPRLTPQILPAAEPFEKRFGHILKRSMRVTRPDGMIKITSLLKIQETTREELKKAGWEGGPEYPFDSDPDGGDAAA